MGRPGEPRDYKREYAQESDERKKDRAQRNKARRMMEREVGKMALKGKDVDHKKPLRNGGTTTRSNIKAASPEANRGWRKGKSGY